jgi:hypothetical protein
MSRQASSSTEFEIIPAMIEAGAEVLGFFDRDTDDRNNSAEEVFRG